MLKEKLKKVWVVKFLFRMYQSSICFFQIKPLEFIKSFLWFFYDYIKLKEINTNEHFTFYFENIYPCLTDRTVFTPVEPTYFYQDTWAAKKIFELKPEHHYDIGSSVNTIAIISQFVPTTMVDIRPIEIKLKHLFFLKASIINLPFADCSIDSISCLCVVEHIGLGRYGDLLDPFGSEKAIKELKRVVSGGG